MPKGCQEQLLSIHKKVASGNKFALKLASSFFHALVKPKVLTPAPVPFAVAVVHHSEATGRRRWRRAWGREPLCSEPEARGFLRTSKSRNLPSFDPWRRRTYLISNVPQPRRVHSSI